MDNKINNDHKMKYYTCKRARLLKFLRDKGFVPYETILDYKNPKYYNWRFYNTPKLQKAIEEYFSQYENN